MKLTTSYAQVVGQVLVYHRKAAGLKQSDMGVELGLSGSGYSRVERGHTTLNVTQLRQAARALALTPAVIIHGADTAAAWVERQGVVVQDVLEDSDSINVAGATLFVLVLSSMPSDLRRAS